MQRAANVARFALRVERFGDRDGFRVHLENGAKRRAAPVQGVDARQVVLGDRLRRGLSPLHPSLKLVDRRLFEIERGSRRTRRDRIPALGTRQGRAGGGERAPDGAIAKKRPTIEFPGHLWSPVYAA